MMEWLNNNQGVIAVVVFALSLCGWLLKLILDKQKKSKHSVNQQVGLKAGRDIKVDNVNILNVESSGFLNLEKQVSSMNSQLKEVLYKMKPSKQSTGAIPESDSDDYKQVMSLISGAPTIDKKKQLRALFYSSTDKIAQLQIIIALASWFNLLTDKMDDIIGMCDEGIRIADLIGAKSEKAVLLAYKGRFVSLQFSNEDLHAAFSVQESNLIIMAPPISEEEKQRVIQRLHKLDKLSQECFAEAEKVAIESRDYEALGYVYMLIGEAAGQRYNHLRNFAPERAKDEKRICKHALLLAKDIYSAAGDELNTANSFHNLANQLRFFGEKEEAKHLTEKVIEIATKHNDQQLLKKAKGLLNRIASGKIPNYMGGEKGDF